MEIAYAILSDQRFCAFVWGVFVTLALLKATNSK